MFKRLPLQVRSVLYAMRGGFLVRPLVIAVVLGFAGAALSELEEVFPVIGAWVPHALFPSRSDPIVAQNILSVIATAIMTVVSIVFAILLMTLTLASMQFSPRILVSFVKDRGTQWTLGVFLGTFSYCMAALPAARSVPHPFAPIATVVGAMLLALVCVGWLLFFIHHISQAISVNHIVDRIARETEAVIDALMPELRGPYARPEAHLPLPDRPQFAVVNNVSGYIRFIDTRRLVGFAKLHRMQIRVLRRVGHFVPEGVPLLMVSRRHMQDPEHAAELNAAFDMGPMRTLQQDVEFGVIQIVDIGLRAISPAVNDPSTAISCIDQLSRILIRWVARMPPEQLLYDPPQALRLILPWITTEQLLHTAFEQLRHYATGDVAVSLRLLRMLQDIAVTIPDEALRRRLVARGATVLDGCRTRLTPEDVTTLEQRLAGLQALVPPSDSRGVAHHAHPAVPVPEPIVPAQISENADNDD